MIINVFYTSPTGIEFLDESEIANFVVIQYIDLSDTEISLLLVE